MAPRQRPARDSCRRTRRMSRRRPATGVAGARPQRLRALRRRGSDGRPGRWTCRTPGGQTSFEPTASSATTRRRLAAVQVTSPAVGDSTMQLPTAEPSTSMSGGVVGRVDPVDGPAWALTTTSPMITRAMVPTISWWNQPGDGQHARVDELVAARVGVVGPVGPGGRGRGRGRRVGPAPGRTAGSAWPGVSAAGPAGARRRARGRSRGGARRRPAPARRR